MELTENVAEDAEGYTGGAADLVCPACLAEGEEATFGSDLANGIVRTAYDASADQADVVHFCIAASDDGDDGADGADDGADDADAKKGQTLDEACPDTLTDDEFDACEALWEAANPDEASARGFVMGFSLLATLALLWK